MASRLLSTYPYIHRKVKFSVLIKKCLFVADGGQCRTLQLVKCREEVTVENPAVWGASITKDYIQSSGNIGEERTERL